MREEIEALKHHADIHAQGERSGVKVITHRLGFVIALERDTRDRNFALIHHFQAIQAAQEC